MQITDLKIKITRCEEPVMAYCSIVFDDCFKVDKIRLVEKGPQLIIAMPSMKNKNNIYRDIAYPITTEMRRKIEVLVLNAYYGQLKSLDLDANNHEPERDTKTTVVKP